jgi:hypothetical protein
VRSERPNNWRRIHRKYARGGSVKRRRGCGGVRSMGLPSVASVWHPHFFSAFHKTTYMTNVQGRSPDAFFQIFPSTHYTNTTVTSHPGSNLALRQSRGEIRVSTSNYTTRTSMNKPIFCHLPTPNHTTSEI